MKCRSCGSENVSFQVVNKIKLKTKHHSFIWWLFIGWWFVPIMWLFFFVPKILLKLFGLGRKNQKAINIEKKVAVCQDCGKSWSV